jgi:hypothetical protein
LRRHRPKYRETLGSDLNAALPEEFSRVGDHARQRRSSSGVIQIFDSAVRSLRPGQTVHLSAITGPERATTIQQAAV